MTTGEIIVCGGGAYNPYLLSRLAMHLPDFRILTSADVGIDPDSVEAAAFAWLASKTLNREAVDFSDITGSCLPVICGGVYYA